MNLHFHHIYQSVVNKNKSVIKIIVHFYFPKYQILYNTPIKICFIGLIIFYKYLLLYTIVSHCLILKYLEILLKKCNDL